MKRSFHLSLGQTVALVAGGGLLMASTFPLMDFADFDRYHVTLAWLGPILSLVPLILGATVALKASAHLKDGIANRLWPEENIAFFRGIFEAVLWRALVGTLLVSAFIATFATPHHRTLSLSLLPLLQSLNSLTTSFMSRRHPAPPPNDWRSRPALHSQQWGKR